MDAHSRQIERQFLGASRTGLTARCDARSRNRCNEYVGLPAGTWNSLFTHWTEIRAMFQQPNLRAAARHCRSNACAGRNRFLRRTSLPIEPRKAWPPGGLPKLGVKAKTQPSTKRDPGRALCVWGDAGWGFSRCVRKISSPAFSDDLVKACVPRVGGGVGAATCTRMGDVYSVASSSEPRAGFCAASRGRSAFAISRRAR